MQCPEYTPEQQALVNKIERKAFDLYREARALGVALRIDRRPLRPLTMGHAATVVDAWIVRKPQTDFDAASEAYHNHYHKIRAAMGLDEWWALWARGETPHQKAAAERQARSDRKISDREWAAQPAGLREGCTTHVPGVGDL